MPSAFIHTKMFRLWRRVVYVLIISIAGQGLSLTRTSSAHHLIDQYKLILHDYIRFQPGYGWWTLINELCFMLLPIILVWSNNYIHWIFQIKTSKNKTPINISKVAKMFWTFHHDYKSKYNYFVNKFSLYEFQNLSEARSILDSQWCLMFIIIILLFHVFFYQEAYSEYQV